MTRFRRTLVGAASELLLLAGVTATGSATPGTGVSDTILAKGTSPNGIVVGSRGITDVAVREITIAPGGSTGWHYHEGALIAVVKSGTLTRTLHDCSTEQTLPGGSFVEPARGVVGVADDRARLVEHALVGDVVEHLLQR